MPAATDPISGKRLGRAAREIVLPAAALAPVDEVPEPPCSLTPDARRIWDETHASMALMGTLARVDYPVLAMWCTAFAQWCRVSERIAQIESGEDADEAAGVAKGARAAFANAIVAKIKAGEEVSRGDLREMQRQRDADLIRLASLQVAAGRLLDQVEKLGRQLGFTPASRIQLACMLKQAETREDGEEFFREARL